MKTKKTAPDYSIRIRRTFSPRESGQFTFDALILDAFFKSKERANSWWRVNAANTTKLGDDTVTAYAPKFQRGDIWPYSVRVVKCAPKEWRDIAGAVRMGLPVNINTTELVDGQPGRPVEAR